MALKRKMGRLIRTRMNVARIDKKKKVKILRIWPKIYLDWHHRIHELTLTSGDKTLTTMAKVTMMIMTHDSQITLEKKN